MTSKYLLVARVSLTVVTLIYGIVPTIADLNETHLLIPNGVPMPVYTERGFYFSARSWAP